MVRKYKVDPIFIIDCINKHRLELFNQGAVAGPSNSVYYRISEELGRKVTPIGIYVFIKQNKLAKNHYQKWGLSDRPIIPQEENGHTLEDIREEELRLEDEMKFMENFDPEKSKREQRKLNRKFSNLSVRKTVYDDKGIHVKTGLDLCDCLNDHCEGCFFPCPKCRSLKCGHECRQNRRWMYETHTIQGMDEMIQNQYLDH